MKRRGDGSGRQSGQSEGDTHGKEGHSAGEKGDTLGEEDGAADGKACVVRPSERLDRSGRLAIGTPQRVGAA